jgi:gamma-glutamyltranspeptidase / glutathione hydrolase
MSLRVAGGNMQPQGQMQLLLRALAQNTEPQTVIDAPRYRFMSDRAINLEDAVAAAVKAGLA